MAGVAVPLPGLGSSDHISVWVSIKVDDQLPPSPVRLPSRRWFTAPWNHIRGAVARSLDEWDPVCLIQ